MANHSIATASGLDDQYKSFFEEFYKVSDITPSDGGTSEKYAEHFTSDATFHLMGKVAKGTQEIIKAREAMWVHVASRAHTPEKILSMGPGSDEVMIYGTVDYTTKDGESGTKHWAARANLVKVDGVVKMEYYQIYI